jgi:LAO/AO transport system kinase
LLDAPTSNWSTACWRAKPRALAKTITLIESTRDDHQARAQKVHGSAAAAHRPGDSRRHLRRAGRGKSTFIEALGNAPDRTRPQASPCWPSIPRRVSGGSILGDKTRMEKLSSAARSLHPPQPSGGSLGGVAEKTREAMLVCEAAGFDVVIVETVGVGQSETAVAGMVDVFVLLQLPNAGDDLQAIKKGIVEMADIVVINKATSTRGSERSPCTRCEAHSTCCVPRRPDGRCRC